MGFARSSDEATRSFVSTRLHLFLFSELTGAQVWEYMSADWEIK